MRRPEVIPLIQGSPEWHELRAQSFTASEAPAMMGKSPYKKRADLLCEKATGIAPDISPEQQRIFDKGHKAEEAARQFVEAEIGDELYPTTLINHIEGMQLLASLDGATMDGSIIWEHKLANKTNVQDVKEGRVPEHHIWQLEHQLLVSGAEKALFTVSSDEVTPITVEYRSDPQKRQALIEGWKQFKEDLADWEPEIVKPELVGTEMESLPDIKLQITGSVVGTNLDTFKAAAMQAIHSINMAPSTDQEFADAEKASKWCKDVEQRVKKAKEMALEQAGGIMQALKALDEIADEARQARLTLEKAVKQRKEQIKLELIEAAIEKISDISAEKGVAADIQQVRARLAAAITGKRSLSGIQEALDGVIIEVRGELAGLADTVNRNRAYLEKHKEFEHLWPDADEIIARPHDEFKTVIDARIALFKAKHNETDQANADEDAPLTVTHLKAMLHPIKLSTADWESLGIKGRKTTKGQAIKAIKRLIATLEGAMEELREPVEA